MDSNLDLKQLRLEQLELEKRAALLARAEYDFNHRVQKEADILAKKMIDQARNERDNARQKAKRLKNKLATLGVL